MKNNFSRGAGALFTSAFIYGFFGILTRLVGFKLPLFYASAVRNILLTAILLVMVLTAKQWKNVGKKDFLWMLFRSCGGIISFIGSYFSMFYIEIGTAYFIFFAGSTVMGYVLGKIMFKEKITRIKWLSFFLSILGLALIYSFNFKPDKILYGWVAFAGGLGVAIWNAFSKKVSDKYSTTQLNLIDTANFVIIEIVISLLLRETWVMPEFSLLWFYMFLFVLMFLVTGQLMIIGFKHLDVSIGSLIILTEAIFGIVLSFLFFKETISAGAILGGILILCAIILPEMKLIHKR